MTRTSNVEPEDDEMDANEDMADPIYDEEADDEDEIISADMGRSLIIRKSFLAPKAPKDEDRLRTRIFHTQCTISGHCCRMIIDGGSGENVVVQEGDQQASSSHRKALYSLLLILVQEGQWGNCIHSCTYFLFYWWQL